MKQNDKKMFFSDCVEKVVCFDPKNSTDIQKFSLWKFLNKDEKNDSCLYFPD